MPTTEQPRPSRSFWLSVPLAAAITWGIHEFAHFQMGRWLGYEMWLSINHAGPVGGTYASTSDAIWIAMAGPFVTYLQAAVALVLVRWRRALLAYPYLFLAWFTRTLAFAVSFANPNDEARTSLDLGLPMWALPTIVVVVLFVMTVAGSRALRLRFRTNALLYAVASLVTTAIVFLDPVVGRILEA